MSGAPVLRFSMEASGCPMPPAAPQGALTMNGIIDDEEEESVLNVLVPEEECSQGVIAEILDHTSTHMTENEVVEGTVFSLSASITAEVKEMRKSTELQKQQTETDEVAAGAGAEGRLQNLDATSAGAERRLRNLESRIQQALGGLSVAEQEFVDEFGSDDGYSDDTGSDEDYDFEGVSM